MSTEELDLSLFEELKADAEKFVEDHKYTSDYANAPLFFLDDGNYWLRFYPQIIEKDGKKRLLIVRTVFLHNFKSVSDIGKRFMCEGPNCRICKETKRLSDAKLKDAYRFTRNEDGIALVNIYRTDAKSDYIKSNEPGFMVFRRKVAIAINNWIAGLDADDLKRVLDPNRKAMIVKLSYTGGTGGGASIGFDIKEAELPPLDSEFPSIFDSYVRESDIASDEEIQKIKSFVNESLARKLNIFNPDDVEEALPSPKVSRSASVDKVLKESVNNPENPCPSSSEGLVFGQHPTEQNINCIVCPIEKKCIEFTAHQDDDIPW